MTQTPKPQLTAVEQAMNWERMSGQRLSDAERNRLMAGGEFSPPKDEAAGLHYATPEAMLADLGVDFPSEDDGKPIILSDNAVINEVAEIIFRDMKCASDEAWLVARKIAARLKSLGIISNG